MRTKGQTIALAGASSVDELHVGTGQAALHQKRVSLEYDARIDNASDTITIEQAKMTSSPLSAEVDGTVGDFRRRQVLDLKAGYSIDWDQLMPIVYELSPGLKKSVAMHGKTSDQFTVTGPAYEAGAQPVFVGLKTDGLAVGWQSGVVYGLQLAAAKLEPTLANGKFTLPKTRIGASGGTINLDGTADFTGETPMLRVPGRLQMLDGINLNTQIGKQLLSYVNPLFMDVAGMQGKVSLVVEEIGLPLNEQIKHTGSGRGRFNMQDVRIEPGGAFGILVKIASAAGQTQTEQGLIGRTLLGQGLIGQGAAGLLNGVGEAIGVTKKQTPSLLEGAVAIRIGNPTFHIADGRINYDNFTLTFPNGVDMVFSGWVGFDDSVKMYVAVPVTAGLLQLAGVKGPLVQYASVLQGIRVDVPIVGTRTASKLDFGRIKIQPLVKQAIRKLAEEGVKEGIRRAVPGAGLLPGLAPGSQQGKGLGLPGEEILRKIVPGAEQKSQQQQPQK